MSYNKNHLFEKNTNRQKYINTAIYCFTFVIKVWISILVNAYTQYLIVSYWYAQVNILVIKRIKVSLQHRWDMHETFSLFVALKCHFVYFMSSFWMITNIYIFIAKLKKSSFLYVESTWLVSFLTIMCYSIRVLWFGRMYTINV